MKIERINSNSLYDSVPYGFSHATLHKETGLVHLAGQVAWDANCNMVGAGDVALQARQALANIRLVLAAVGCGPEDVVQLRTFVVNHSPDKLGPILQEIGAFYGNAIPAPNTFLGVATLALPDFLVEIEAVAAVP
jgi:enamine deaminase RidA (YjgF/YER057c/UK114 family)